MLDIETVGTSADSAILTIGLAHFDMQTGAIIKSAEFRNSQAAQEKLGRKVDPATVAWWGRQSPAARARLVQEPLYEPIEMMRKVYAFLHAVSSSQWNLGIWAKGPGFDMTLCRSLTEDLNAKWKGHFSREYCVRTMLLIDKEMGWNLAEGIYNDLDHGAEADAVYQAKQVSAIWQRIGR
tara:strand:+ start:13661 stop:14200 length:540 start_codon:yes stop_codon:yes gene_type:complete